MLFYSIPVRWPGLSVVKVRDERLEWLRDVYQPKKFTPASVEVCDLPGLPDPSDMAGVKLSELLGAARDADGLIVCVRAFEDPTYPYSKPKADPAREARDVISELAFADLEIATRRMEKLEKKGGNRTDTENRELAALAKVVGALEDGRPLKSLDVSAADAKLLKGYAFLSAKPWILVGSLPDEGGEEAVAAVEGPYEARLSVRAKLEAEVSELDEEDRAAFMDELGLQALAGESVLAAAFQGLRTVCFFTTGSDEVRAWPILRGTKSVEAAGTVHTDMARGFIRAEVYSWQDLKDAGGDEAAVKKAGKFRLEGKGYEVQDGDVFHVRFSV